MYFGEVTAVLYPIYKKDINTLTGQVTVLQQTVTELNPALRDWLTRRTACRTLHSLYLQIIVNVNERMYTLGPNFIDAWKVNGYDVNVVKRWTRVSYPVIRSTPFTPDFLCSISQYNSHILRNEAYILRLSWTWLELYNAPRFLYKRCDSLLKIADYLVYFYSYRVAN